MIRLLIVAIFIWSIANPLSARMLREYSIEEKVNNSDVIFIGEVKSVITNDSKANIEKYSVVRIIKIIKGNVATPELNFILEGPIQEEDPLCCTLVGEKYLFFASDKVIDKMVFIDNKIDFEYKKINNFYYAINGSFSTYKVEDNYVIGWDKCSHKSKLKTVLSSIRKMRIKADGVSHRPE